MANNKASEIEGAPYVTSGALQLTDQPLEVRAKQEPSEDWGQIFSHLESRLGQLRVWRYSWWSYWAQLAEWVLPFRYKWLVVANTMSRGFPLNTQIMDGTATQDMLICSSGLQEGLMSPSRPWLRLSVSLPGYEPDAAGKMWLEDTADRVLTVFGMSNFYDTTAQAFEDVTTFGTSVVIIYEDAEDGIRAYSPCAGEYYLGNSPRGNDEVMYREFTYTVSQLVEFFTLERCPDQVQKLWRTGGGSLEMEFVVAHAIEPNFPIDNGQGGKILPVKGGFPWREIYWLKGMKTPSELSRRGFWEKPFFVMRWAKVSNDAYGRNCPGMNALGDIKQLQVETRRKAEFLEKGVRPPMGADPTLKNEPSSILPGNITYFSATDGKKGFFPLFEVNPGWIQPITVDIGLIQARIHKFFFTDVFMLFQQMEGVQPRNEMEIAERKGEKIQRLGPMIGLFESEAAAPAIRRTIAIMSRARLLKPMPQSLKAVVGNINSLKIEYVSMMKLAQRAAETAAMEGGFAVGGKLSEAAKAANLPDPLRIINLDESLRAYLDLTAFPERGLFTPDQVAKADQMKTQAQEQAQQSAQAAQTAMAAVQAAQSLSQTDVGGGQNALAAMLGNQGGAPAPGSGV